MLHEDELIDQLFQGIEISNTIKLEILSHLSAFEQADLQFKINDIKRIFSTYIKITQNTVISDSSAKELLEEIKARKSEVSNDANRKKKTFKSLIEVSEINENNDLVSLSTKDLAYYEFIYRFGIVYLDAFKEIPNVIQILNKKKNIVELNAFTDFNSLLPKSQVNKGLTLLSDPIEKAKMYLNHLQIARYFAYQHKNFKSPFNNTKNAVPLYDLGFLLGNTKVVTVIGVLIVAEDGKYQLQDEKYRINLDCSTAQWDKAYFPPGSVVLCEGKYDNTTFKALYILQPQVPVRNLDFNNKLDNDYFGAITKIVKKFDQKQAKLRQENEKNNNINNENNIISDMYYYKESFEEKVKSFIFPLNDQELIPSYLSKIQSKGDSSINKSIYTLVGREISNTKKDLVVVINNPILSEQNVIDGLKRLFIQLSTQSLPAAIVFMGNFLPDSSFLSFRNQESYFNDLGILVSSFEELNKNTVFCFVPGNEDIQASCAFPIHTFPEYLQKSIRKNIPNSLFCTNPARLSIFGKDMLFFRDDLQQKLARNSLGPINENKNKHFYINSLLGQCNLMPLEQNKSPRIWHLAHSLMYAPGVDYLVIGDKENSFNFYNEEKAIHYTSPGDFSKDYSYQKIYVLSNKIESNRASLLY